MGKARCVKARIEEISFDAHWHTSLLRIKAGGKVFFSCWPLRAETDFLENLAVGTEVSLGVYPFPDGTFGMHWLHAPGYGTAEDHRWGTRIMVTMLCLFASIAAISLFLHVMDASWVWGLILLMGGVFIFSSYLYATTRAMDGNTRKLRRDLREVKKGYGSHSVPYESLVPQFACNEVFAKEVRADSQALYPAGTSPDSPDEHTSFALPTREDGRFSLVSGKAENIKTAWFSRGTGKTLNFFLSYTFTCDGRELSIVIPDTSDYLCEGYHKNHPFMLAEGDRVRAVVQTDGETVLALRNDADGCAYWVCGLGGRAKLKKTALSEVLCFIGIVLMLMGMDYADQGAVEWDLLKQVIGYVGAGAALVLLVLAFKGGAAHIGPGDYRQSRAFILRSLDMRTGKGDGDPYLHEL